MTTKHKALLLYTFSFALLFLVFYIILKYLLNIKNTILIAAMSAGFASIFAPQTTIVQKQTGTYIQLKVWFTKRVILLKSN